MEVTEKDILTWVLNAKRKLDWQDKQLSKVREDAKLVQEMSREWERKFFEMKRRHGTALGRNSKVVKQLGKLESFCEQFVNAYPDWRDTYEALIGDDSHE